MVRLTGTSPVTNSSRRFYLVWFPTIFSCGDNKGGIRDLVRETRPYWICHRAKVHQRKREDVNQAATSNRQNKRSSIAASPPSPPEKRSSLQYCGFVMFSFHPLIENYEIFVSYGNMWFQIPCIYLWFQSGHRQWAGGDLALRPSLCDFVHHSSTDTVPFVPPPSFAHQNWMPQELKEKERYVCQPVGLR